MNLTSLRHGVMGRVACCVLRERSGEARLRCASAFAPLRRDESLQRGWEEGA